MTKKELFETIRGKIYAFCIINYDNKYIDSIKLEDSQIDELMAIISSITVDEEV
jgi:hypothetical protein